MKKNLTQGSNLNKLRGLGGKSVRAKLSKDEWNFFDERKVSNHELAACCLWEYARESNSIRDMARIDPEWKPFYQKPFPDTWQSLNPALRRKLSVQAAAQLQVAPFRVINAEVPWTGKQSRHTRIEINWTSYTDGEIASCFKAWVKANRPPDIAEPTKRGHKPRDWRASLERLGIMRLMHYHSFDEMTAIVDAVAAVKSADREKYSVKSESMKERQKAIADFHCLFPFLRNENPLSLSLFPGGW